MDPKVHLTHQDLIERCKKGHRKSQRALYEQYVRAMYNIAIRMLDVKEEAEDIVQDSFMDAFRYLNGFKYESSFGAWLKRIVINKCINRLKMKKIDLLTLDGEAHDFGEEVEDVDLELDMAKVMKGISLLPDGYRQILSLYLIEGFDHGEISEYLGITISTSKSQYHRAKKNLINIIKGL